MTSRHLEAVVLTVANADPFLLPWMIRQADEHGATPPQILAIDAGYCLSTDACFCPSEGWAAPHERASMGRRGPLSRRCAPGTTN